VPGATTKNFGDPDGFGGQQRGVSIAAPAGATVSTPADAWVAYAGPYRSYGQLLILNAGEGYYLVLAGMERIEVSVGQFVLAGEPVAVMSGGRVAGAAIGVMQPVLYIELRKNDTVIDPNPWWAKSNLEKARG
jgi:septal ring factor EnvC (AmiA/AmiB activator)